ncbi:hypothetical protein [Parendozoicomonas haliclonae]|uniref:Uncharacterized protein n=1 Tax=Parendozoicomonas haliclonae TaxID=1960125 RepID=A0A1X7AQ66_9GAMM|nr:hypothetical protein [Parendozoicomonas haliclonae]SMA50436.1 hypothetical protein EHSB41UT_04234 [Parendozoicomonas haliclonae]
MSTPKMFNHKTQLILVALATVLITVFTLHANGYLRHSSEQDALYISEFSLIASVPGAQGLVSTKPADFIARCDGGYLVMDAAEKVSKNLTGVLVDQKNRLISCR